MTHSISLDHYVFAYFTSAKEVDGEQVRLARSCGQDVIKWQILNDGKPLIKSTVGRSGIRDPFLLRAVGLAGEQAKFYLLGTDLKIGVLGDEKSWSNALTQGSRSIVISQSNDLVNWTDPEVIELLPEGFGNLWAPEAVFDEIRGEYFIFWASTSILDDGTVSHNRMLAAWTKDFRTFTEPFIWADPGWSVIDATLARSGNYWYRVTKDERSKSSDLPSAKFLTIERSQTLENTHYEFVVEGTGSRDPSDGRTPLRQGEGPILIWSEAKALWFLFIDEFGHRGYVPFQSSELESGVWSMCQQYELPASASHGGILAITKEEWQKLGELITR